MRPRPFRFGVNLFNVGSRARWQALCRQTEDLGYDVIAVPDHLGYPAPFPTLVAAAEATSRPRLGTFVLNAGFSRPALLAREVATTDQLTDGRLELGLGTGYVPAEFEAAELSWPSARQRVEHLEHTVTELRRLLTESDHQPPVRQHPMPPLLIGGHSDRVLRLAAAHADIIGFTGAVAGAEPGTLALVDTAELAERVEFARSAAADRANAIELNLLIQTVKLTEDREAELASLRRYDPGLSDEELLRLPMLLTGTDQSIACDLHEYRERYGFSYFTVLEPAMVDFAKVISRMR